MSRRLTIDLTGGAPLFRPEVLRAVLERFMAHESLRPATWGLDEKSSKPASLASMVLAADGKASTRLLRLKRKAPALEAFISLGNQPRVTVQISSDDLSADGPSFVQFADALAEVFQPDIGWVHGFFDIDPPLDDATTLAWWTMDQLVDGGLRGYGNSGPGGLAMVTYFAPRWASGLGARLRKVPGLAIQSLAWGGLRVSLGAEVFEAPDERLAELWNDAMDRVQSEQVFARCTVRRDGATSFVRSPGFTWPADYRR